MQTVRGTVEGAGVELAYEEHGPADGAGLLVLHDVAQTSATWSVVAAELGASLRVVVPDRRGYGASGAPQPYTATTVEEQAEDAAAVLRGLRLAPAVVAGVGFGALVALDLLARHGDLVRSAVLADPPALALVPDATAVLAEAQGRMRDAVQAGGPAAGVAAWTGTEPAPDAVRGFYADVAGLSTLALTRGGLRAIATPVTVLTGPRTAPHLVAAADALAGLLGRPTRRADGALTAAVSDAAALAS